MGVNLLWKLLEPHKESTSLALFAEEHARHARLEGGNATPMVGVDMGTCMAECSAGARLAGVHSQRAGGGLYNFFKKLTEFIKAPVIYIFVFDGAGRPYYKRGHKVTHQPIWWADLAVEFIKAFGHEVHNAPGEAEAELARMNTEGLIDAVITSDGDAYVFGTKTLLRSISKNDRRYNDEYSLYSSVTGPLQSRGGLVLFALLSGGDYSLGVRGCGPSTALALVKCGFGDELITALENLSTTAFDTFLDQWRMRIRVELLTNSQGFLPRRHPALSVEIDDGFPSCRILKLYARPLTSWSPGQAPPDAKRWTFQQPSIPAIAKLTCQHLHWKDPLKMKEDFQKMLWKGVFLQMLYSSSAVYTPDENSSRRCGELNAKDSSHSIDIFEIKLQVRRGQYVQQFGQEPQPMLVVSASQFNRSMGYKFARSLSTGKFTVWPQHSRLPAQLALQLDGRKSSDAEALQGGSTLNQAGAINWILTADNHWYADLTL